MEWSVDVSVIVAVRNGEKFIERTLDSLLCQTYTGFEILIVDDGSTDCTMQIVRRYEQKSDKIRVSQNDGPHGNAGAYAKAYGVRQARGDWIAICDADDTWARNKLQYQIDFCGDWKGPQPLVAVGTAGYVINERDHVIANLDAGPTTFEEFQALKRNCRPFVLHHSSVVFHKNTFLVLGGYTDTYTGTEDTELWTRMAEQGVVISIPKRLFYYRKHLGSFQLAHTEKQALNFMRIEENVRRRRNGLAELDYDEFFHLKFQSMSVREKESFTKQLRGKLYYRMGATLAVNRHYIRGTLYLIRATLCDYRRVTGAIRRVIVRH